MEKHAVPQNIMDVEFKLFGALTVKQFSYIAFTALGALLIYSSGLPTLITIPIVIVLVGVGLAMAFLTVNGQPFATWFGNFAASLFLSQRKVYRKNGKTPAMLGQTTVTKAYDPASLAQTTVNKPTAYQQRIQELRDTQLDSAIIEPESNKTNEAIPDMMDDNNHLANLDKYFDNKIDQELSSFRPAPTPIPNPEVKKEETINLVEPIEYTIPAPQPSNVVVNEPAISQIDPASINLEVNILNNMKPNQIAGYVNDHSNQPVDRAEVIVKTAKNELLRAVYTDPKGKFIIPSPLPAGEYYVEIRKVGLTFPEYDLKLENQIVPLFRYVAN